MRPIDALQLAISRGVMVHRGRPSWNKPGGVVSSMRGEAREALGRLTSDELAQVRVDPWELQDEAWTRKQEVGLRPVRALLENFDQQCVRA